MSAGSSVPMPSPQAQPQSFGAVQGPSGRVAGDWVRRAVWVACCLTALATHTQVVAQAARPDVSRAVEVAPPADWKPGDPLLSSDEAPPVTRVPSERSAQAGEARGVRQRQAEPVREAPAIQRLASKPRVASAQKAGEQARGSSPRQAAQKATQNARVATRPTHSAPSRDRRSAAVDEVARQSARKSVSKSTAVAGQKKTARDMARTGRAAATSARAPLGGAAKQRAPATAQKLANAKPGTRARSAAKAPPVAPASAKTARSRAATAVQARQGRTQAKRAAPQAPRSTKSDRSAPPRATRKGAPGDAKQTVRRAR